MFRDASPMVQALTGGLLTYGVTALGAALVFFLNAADGQHLCASLGFAAGVMLSASFWCLLQPALSTAEESGIYGHRFAIVPVLLGFLVGCLFMEISDRIVNGDVVQFFRERTAEPSDRSSSTSDDLLSINSDVRRRKGISKSKSDSSRAANSEESTDVHWRRMILLIIAVVVHNIPEGFAVGTAFAASGNKDTSFEAARSLAFAIAMQNFPEGFVVSMPLKMAGASSTAAFFWGQLSGMVEPIAAVVGVLVNEISQVLTPYSMSFAAGAMVYVVIDDVLPEGRSCGSQKLLTWSTVAGFVLMTLLDITTEA